MVAHLFHNNMYAMILLMYSNEFGMYSAEEIFGSYFIYILELRPGNPWYNLFDSMADDYHTVEQLLWTIGRFLPLIIFTYLVFTIIGFIEYACWRKTSHGWYKHAKKWILV